MNCYLYWIHAPHHTDIFKEGYIGISIDPKRRFRNHKKRKQNPILENAFNKYECKLTILLQSTIEYCKEIEIKLRPVKEIGWNICEGGGIPPSPKGKIKSPMSEEHKLKISLSKKGQKINVDKRGPMSDETKNKIGKANKGKRKPEGFAKGHKNPFYGKTWSQEDRKRISDGLKRFHATQAHAKV